MDSHRLGSEEAMARLQARPQVQEMAVFNMFQPVQDRQRGR